MLRALTICFLLVYFVSAAGCHCFDLQSCFNDAAFSELTRMILKGTCRMKLDKIGKFLSAVLDRTDALLRDTE